MPELGADVLIALLTLTAMEIVLGVDNVVFISILTGRLPADQAAVARRVGLGLALVMRIGLLLAMDIVFSLDSVITAVGMANEIWVMVTAMVVAVGVMLVSAGAISRFVEAHPSVKILALSFLLLIGVMLVAEGTGQHVGKGYIYAAMAFSLLVELLNLRYRQKRAPLALHGRFEHERAAGADPS